MSAPQDALTQRRLELERRLAALSPTKRALLEQSAALVPGAGDARPSIPRRERGAPAPMSFAQELLWLLQRATPDAHGYNVPRVVRLRGGLHVAALRRALDAVVTRHEVLRSTFEVVEGEPRQIVHPPRAVSLTEIDLRDVAPGQREAEAVRIVRDLVRRPFDLATDLQLRAALVHLAPDDVVLVLESHHVASDAWSRNILLREIAAFYAHEVRGAGELPAELPIQYGDFAAWQRRTLGGAALDRLVSYWREQLEGAPERLELPTDHPRSGAPTFEGATRSLMLSASLLEQLRALSRERGVTLFTTLLAAFDVLLARYSGHDDVVVGSPIAGRAVPETESVIGYFANTLVLRTRLDGDPTFAELMQRVRETALGAFDHQDIPYEKLVDELQRGRGGLVQVMFTLQDAELRSLTLEGLRSEPFGTSRGAAKFDLALFMHEQPTGLRAAIEYRTDLFDAATIDRMLAHLERILEQVASNPSIRTSAIDLRTAAERALVARWNDTGAPYSAELTLHELIARQCARTPNSAALEWESDGRVQRLTFAQLDEATSALADTLRAAGIGAGDGVGICALRGPELVIAMVATMRAGAYYLPLDPEYPAERIAFMLGDAKPPLVLATEATLDVVRAAGTTDVRLVSLSWTDAALMVSGTAAPHDRMAARALATPSDLAYVIYTSGSTGRPKGVMIPHRAVVNYLEWMARAFDVGPSDSILQKAPASFDACIWEFFLPLVTGARLVLARPGGHQDPVYLLEAIARHDVSLLQLVPSQLRMLLETAGVASPTGLPRLRRLFLGGEALPSELLQATFDACPSLAVTNLYGPTEATVYAAVWNTDSIRWNGGSVPIGVPIANATIHVRDPFGVDVPLGIAGELCIGGVGLATGYLHRPELTAERFVDDAQSDRANVKLYCTGDRARWRADGMLEYLGRIDNQVKLRGFRVELGEIEAALAAQPEVASAAAVVREDVAGDQRLVAYCIAAHADVDRTTIGSAVRARLKTSLPEFMVPSAIVWLDAWPLNANGKLDRKALPAPDALPVSSPVAPCTDTERALAAIWEEVLGRAVGTADDFFDVGGHSLLALRVLSRISDRLGARLPLRAMFEAATIAELANRVETELRNQRGNVRASIRRIDGDAAPLTNAQEVLWLVQRATPESTAYNLSEQWDVRGDLDVSSLGKAITMLLERNDALRTLIVSHPSGAMQRVAAVPVDPLNVVDLQGEREAVVAANEAARALASTPFDLEHEQPARFTLFTLGNRHYRLVFVTHHIVFDGWSRGLLVRELSTLYAAARNARDAGRAPGLRLVDVAAWERGADGIARRSASVSFWREHLAGADGALVLPETRPMAGVTHAAAKERIVLDASLVQSLEALARRNDATMFMVLLAAFKSVLHRYGNLADVVVATVQAGRDVADVEPIVGYFTNTVAYRTRFADSYSFRDVLRQVRETHLAASEQAAVPYEMIAEDPRMPPLPRVLFAMQNNSPARLSLGDATVEATGVESSSAKFDLFLSMAPTRDGLRATLQYRTDLFARETAQRVLSHVSTIIAAVVLDETRRIDELPLLDEEERTLLRREWCGEVRDFDTTATLPALLERQMRATPDAPAIVDGERVVSFAELDRRSAALARHLASLGARPGTFVAVCMERSAELVIALTGVLRAGAAYVPIDPAYPSSRIAFMLEDTRAPIIVTDAATLRVLPELRVLEVSPSRRLVVADEPLATDDERATSVATADDVSYVIYTSGSTGRPKGVLIEHRNVVAFVDWAQSVFSRDELSGVLASTSVCFDLSVFEIFVPLATGGTTVVVRDVLALAGERPVGVPVPVTLINTVPSAIAELLRSGAIPPTVTTVNLAGELLQQHVVDALYAIPTVHRVYDLYGPSEDTTYSTFTLRRAGGRPTIGRPIANTRAYVRDARGELLPIGIPGELYLAGAGVARGYHERPELTQERFALDPFADVDDGPRARMYRTGDLVRWAPTGELEYLGRLDNQVKLRGFRIELGEIDAALLAYPGIVSAASLVRVSDAGDSTLVSFVVAAGSDIDAASVRGSLATRLPHYMVPSAIVALSALPMTANGKIDRRALGAIEIAARASLPLVEPRTPTEVQLGSIWSDVLRRSDFGVQQNFFDLGGHSLLAMRIVARVQDAFGVRLRLGAVMEHPTIELLAPVVEVLISKPVTAEPRLRRATRVATRRPIAPDEQGSSASPALPDPGMKPEHDLTR